MLAPSNEENRPNDATLTRTNPKFAHLIPAYLESCRQKVIALQKALDGRDLWSTGVLGTTYWMPLYPALVGLTGAGWGQMTLDIALSTIAVWLIYRLTLTVF